MLHLNACLHVSCDRDRLDIVQVSRAGTSGNFVSCIVQNCLVFGTGAGTGTGCTIQNVQFSNNVTSINLQNSGGIPVGQENG